MIVIDSQVHAYEANTPKRPWHSVPNWPDHVTGDEMAAAMDKVGVDGAIFISAFSLYRYDASYAVEVQRAHPDRFAIVKPVDPDEDPLLERAIEIVVQTQTASVSLIQRRLRVGYTRAGRLIDMLERRGIISGYEGSKPRRVLVGEGELDHVLAGASSESVV